MDLSEKHQIILNAFLNPRYGISPTATRGAVESFARKHQLTGQEFTEALDSAIAAGLIAPMADSGLTIRNAGRKIFPQVTHQPVVTGTPSLLIPRFANSQESTMGSHS